MVTGKEHKVLKLQKALYGLSGSTGVEREVGQHIAVARCS